MRPSFILKGCITDYWHFGPRLDGSHWFTL